MAEQISPLLEQEQAPSMMTEAEYKHLGNIVASQYLKGRYTVEFPADGDKAYFTLQTKKIVVGQKFLEQIYKKEGLSDTISFAEFTKYLIAHEFGHFFDLYFSPKDMQVQESFVQTMLEKDIKNPVWSTISADTKKKVIYKIMNLLDDPWTDHLSVAKSILKSKNTLSDLTTKGFFSQKDLTELSPFLQTGYYYLLAATLQTSNIPYTLSPEIVRNNHWTQFCNIKTDKRMWKTVERRKSTTIYKNTVTELIELLTDQDVEQLEAGEIPNSVPHFLPGELTDELAKDMQAAIVAQAEKEKDIAQHIDKLNHAKSETAGIASELEKHVQEILDDVQIKSEIEPRHRQARGHLTDKSLMALKMGQENAFARKKPIDVEKREVVPFDMAVLIDDSGSISNYSELLYKALALLSNVFTSLRNKTPNSQLFFSSVGTEISKFYSTPEESVLGFTQGSEAFYKAFIKSQAVMSDAKSKFPGEKRRQIVLVVTDGQFTGEDVEKIPETLQNMKDRDDIIVLPIPVNLSLIADFARNFESLGVPTPSSEEIDINYIVEYIKALVKNVISQETT